MKYLFIFYLAFIHVFVGIAILKTDIILRIQDKLGFETLTDELTPHFHTMLAFHERVDQNIPANSVLFIGDSITQGLAVSAVFPKSVNLGIGQDTTFGVLTRLPHYSSISSSKLVVIAIGVNDLRRRSDEKIIENYRGIIELIPETIPVLFSAILPVNEIASDRLGDNIRIRKVNKGLKEICSSSRRLYFLDSTVSLVDSNGYLSDKYHIGDGVHLNATGNSVWISKLKAEVINIISHNNEK